MATVHLGQKILANIRLPDVSLTSAALYSLVDTSKANNLGVYDYIELPMSQSSPHFDDAKCYVFHELM